VCMSLTHPMLAQTKLYEQATGDNLEAYKHEDKFTPWQKLSKEDSPYVYCRSKICTAIANSKTRGVEFRVFIKFLAQLELAIKFD